jgi:hypothetical protein
MQRENSQFILYGQIAQQELKQICIALDKD